jgi:large subunit ribosomal protein L21
MTPNKQRARSTVYAIVRSGGTQQKVAVGDVIEIDSLTDQVGDTVSLSAVPLSTATP